jgi:hypothetical protein
MPRFRTAESYRPCRRVEAARLSGVCVHENHKVMSSRICQSVKAAVFLHVVASSPLSACYVVVLSTPQRSGILYSDQSHRKYSDPTQSGEALERPRRLSTFPQHETEPTSQRVPSLKADTKCSEWDMPPVHHLGCLQSAEADQALVLQSSRHRLPEAHTAFATLFAGVAVCFWEVLLIRLSPPGLAEESGRVTTEQILGHVSPGRVHTVPGPGGRRRRPLGRVSCLV